MTVYVVTNGDRIESAWKNPLDAQTQADALNDQPGFHTDWTVIATELKESR